MLTDAEITAALAICEAATPGKWAVLADFIAAARSEKTGWPAALREAQRLRQLLREYKESTTSLAENWNRRDPTTILAELFAALEDET